MYIYLKLCTIHILIHTNTNNHTWGQVHKYLFLSTFKYTFDNTCTLLKYFLIPAGVLVLIVKYQMHILSHAYVYLSTNVTVLIILISAGALVVVFDKTAKYPCLLTTTILINITRQMFIANCK